MESRAHSQALRLSDLIRAAQNARGAAERGLLFASRPGLRLVNAAFELFECDALYDLADTVADGIGADRDGWPMDEQGERKPLP